MPRDQCRDGECKHACAGAPIRPVQIGKAGPERNKRPDKSAYNRHPAINTKPLAEEKHRHHRCYKWREEKDRIGIHQWNMADHDVFKGNVKKEQSN